MTAKELLLERVPTWSEDDAEIALRAVEHKHEAESEDKPGDSIDEWGNLDAQMGRAMTGALRDLDEEERKDGFAPWQP